MPEDRTECELRARFQKLRGEEERRVPPFEPLLRSARRAGQPVRQPIRLWAGLAGATAVAAALVLALGIFPPHQRQPAVDIEAWSALSQWTASTDTYLECPGPRWGGNTIATPSDTLMSNTLETEEQQSSRKETL